MLQNAPTEDCFLPGQKNMFVYGVYSTHTPYICPPGTRSEGHRPRTASEGLAEHQHGLRHADGEGSPAGCPDEQHDLTPKRGDGGCAVYPEWMREAGSRWRNACADARACAHRDACAYACCNACADACADACCNACCNARALLHAHACADARADARADACARNMLLGKGLICV